MERISEYPSELVAAEQWLGTSLPDPEAALALDGAAYVLNDNRLVEPDGAGAYLHYSSGQPESRGFVLYSGRPRSGGRP